MSTLVSFDWRRILIVRAEASIVFFVLIVVVVSNLLVDHLEHLILVQIVQLSHHSIRRQLKIVDVVVDRPEPAQDLLIAIADVARRQLVLKRHKLSIIRVVQDGKLLA